MSVEITGSLTGKLTCEARHGPSGATLRTTAPVDNGGDGSCFSPTDLCATSIGVCMLTIMDQWAQKYGFDLRGTSFRLEKHMVTDPRRIGHVPITFDVKGNIPPDKRERMEAAAMKCPVKQSLHPDVKVDVVFRYG